MHSNMAECECQTLSFELDPSLTRSLCLKSKLPSDLRGWTVELDRTEASACGVLTPVSSSLHTPTLTTDSSMHLTDGSLHSDYI